MKKLLSLVLVLTLAFSLAACSKTVAETTTAKADTTVAATTAKTD